MAEARAGALTLSLVISPRDGGPLTLEPARLTAPARSLLAREIAWAGAVVDRRPLVPAPALDISCLLDGLRSLRPAHAATVASHCALPCSAGCSYSGS
jgi:hypothetical protein